MKIFSAHTTIMPNSSGMSWRNHDIPPPKQSPKYSQKIYNYIKAAVNHDLPVASMGSKDWYNFILSSVLYEPDGENPIPCRVEIRNPLLDCLTGEKPGGLHD